MKLATLLRNIKACFSDAPQTIRLLVMLGFGLKAAEYLNSNSWAEENKSFIESHDQASARAFSPNAFGSFEAWRAIFSAWQWEDQQSDVDQYSALAAPLDLSELLHQLNDIPQLPSPKTNLDLKASECDVSEGSLIELVSGTKASPVGSRTESTRPTNPLRPTPGSSPTSQTANNDLEPSILIGSDSQKTKPLEASASAESKQVDDELRLEECGIGEEPKSISQLKLEATAKLPKSKTPSNLTIDIPVEESRTASSRPKVRPIQIKDWSQASQESPEPSEITADSSGQSNRDDDAKALMAEQPEATKKTFVRSLATRRLSDNLSTDQNQRNQDDQVRLDRIEKCLGYYLANLETTVERSPWSVMHAMLPFGVEGEILVGTKRTNAIQWLCHNGTCRGQRLFTPTKTFFKPNIGGGVQGHEGQFLAMLAQSQVSADYPMVIGGHKYKVMDLIRYEMATCRERTELTFKLIGLSYYVDTTQIWTSDGRSRWNIEKLVKEELAQPINGSACGGTHRLMGLTFAVRQRQAEGRPINGQFAKADRFIKDFVEYAWQLQNSDGSFSTNWFESRGNEPNSERKVQTTGHILEWLAFTVPDEELNSARFKKSLDFLLANIWEQRQHKWPIGPRGHATRALALYQQRVTGIQPGQRRKQMAEVIQWQRNIR